jgi:hypothetical protein
MIYDASWGSVLFAKERARADDAECILAYALAREEMVVLLDRACGRLLREVDAYVRPTHQRKMEATA